MVSFSDTILQVMFNYRQLLKRQLKVGERRAKLRALGLSSGIDHADDQVLYELGHRILLDLKAHASSSSAVPSNSYYSYSGVQKFIEHLEVLLEQYEIQDGQVIHRGQKASRALLHVIQALTHSEIELNEELCFELRSHGQVIADHGSQEQHHSYRNALKKFLNTNELFFGQLLQEFEQAL